MWAVRDLDLSTVGAMAVDDEPTVFWDGTEPDPAQLVEQWKSVVGWMDGDEGWGRVTPTMNGTSGRTVVKAVLEPLGVRPDATWFTDAVDRFYVKRGSRRSRQQADVIDDVYNPFATAANLEPAQLPLRPSVRHLIEIAEREHAGRLRAELETAAAPIVVTLGEEARQVLHRIADDSSGPPTAALDATIGAYGGPGKVRVGGHEARWYALVHPGQRSPTWANAHKAWAARART